MAGADYLADYLIVSRDTKRANRVPPGQHLVKDWPVLHYGKVHEVPADGWKFEITGEVEKPLTLGYAEFSALPKVRVFSDIHCVTKWSKLDTRWEGVGVDRLLESVANTLAELGIRSERIRTERFGPTGATGTSNG